VTLAPLARHRALLATAAACLAGVAAFARSLGFGFVYDDHWTIEGGHLDAPLRELLGAIARGAGRELHIPDETRPAMVTSTWVDHALFHGWPAGYHADSLLLYGLVCALAVRACLAMTGRLRVALVAGLFFALAPVHAEVVCAINYREDLLAAVGVFVPLALLLRRGAGAGAGAGARRGVEWVAVGCWAIGLLGKESAVALVPIVAAVAVIDPVARARLRRGRRTWVAMAAVLAVWAIWRGALVAHGDDIPRSPHGAVVPQLLGTARFCVRAGVASLLPFHPSPEYLREPPASPLWLVPLLAWVALAWFLARRRATRTPAVGLAVILLAGLPSSPLAAPSNEFADRYAFLSVLGAGLVYGWIANRLVLRRHARVGWVACATGFAAMWLACQAAAAPWRSDRTLWIAATELAPASPRAWEGLSRVRRLDGDLDGADRDIDRAIALDPRFVPAHVTRVYNLLARGDVDGARAELAAIRALGGDHERGVPRATRCAALPPDGAKECVR
jgi:hypothetical protein